MLNIAIVDDCRDDVQHLRENLKRYFASAKIEYTVNEVVPEGDYIEKLRRCSLLFLDIDMPEINGIKMAEEIRKNNLNIGIVFVTNFFQYAVDGYHVDAIDYFLKPIEYEGFRLKMKRIVEIVLSMERNERKVSIRTKGGLKVIPFSDLVLVEVQGHYLKFRLMDGSEFQCRGSLTSIRDELGKEFELCNSYYLIHLPMVKGIKKENVVTDIGEFPISRTKRKAFLDAFASYLGGTSL